MLPYILIIVLCVFAGVGTILVGLKPKESNYEQNTKNKYFRLLAFYGLAAIVLLVIFLISFS